MNEGKKSFDPGWNDPPLFSYDSNQTTPAAKSYSLNKRVAYRLDGNNSEPPKHDISSNSVKTLPPTGPPPVIALNKSLLQENVPKESNSEKEILLSEVLENFHRTIDEVYINGNERESSEIKKRLTIMEKMWNEEKFPSSMQQKLNDISEGLLKNDTDGCDNLQRSIMVDYTPLCSTWMSAIRLLINAKRTKLNVQQLIEE